MMKRKIYVASSWRNEYYPEVVAKLREAGHDVYDFRNPPSGDPGFKWSIVSEDYMEWSPEQYRDMLQHPKAEWQFHNDIEAMEACDTCVLVLPCGRSAHTEAGWFAGREKLTIAYIPERQEPELMYKLFNKVCCTIDELTETLKLKDTDKLSKCYEAPFEEDGLVMTVADFPSRDIAEELTDLHDAKGAEFVRLLKQIASHGEFKPLENEPKIYFTGGERGDDFPNLLDAAHKAVGLGYKVYILPNPKGIRTADFIFERKGVIGLYDLKTIQGKASVSNRLTESIGQTNRVLLNMTTDYNARLLASDIKSFFEKSRDAIEVLIFKGNKAISIKRGLVQNTAFNRLFRKLYEK